MNEDIKLAVKKGAAWLDENHPGWEQRIDLSKLHMNRCESCVIGQAVGKYWAVTIEAARNAEYDGGGDVWAAEHGFDVAGFDHDDDYTMSNSYRALETEWSEVVRDRLGRL